MKNHLVTILTSLSLIVNAQVLSDDIQQQLSQIAEDTAKISWLLTQSEGLLYDAPDQSLLLARRAYNLSLEQENNAYLGATATQLSDVFYRQVAYDSSLTYLEQALFHYQEKNEPPSIGRTLVKQARVLRRTSNHTTAQEKAFQAVELFEQVDDQAGLALSYAVISQLLFGQREFHQAIEYAQKAIDIQKALGESEDLIFSYIAKAYQYFGINDMDSVIINAQKAYDLGSALQLHPLQMATPVNTLGNGYKLNGQFEQAINVYKQNLITAQQFNDPRLENVSYANLGHAHLLNEDYQDALAYLLPAIKNMEESGDRINVMENYGHAYNAYASLEDFENAFLYQGKYMAALEERLSETIDNLNSELTAKYEAGQREATIVLQNKQIKQQKLIQYLVIGVAVLLAIILFLLYRNYRSKQRSNEHLSQLNNSLEAKNKENELLLKEIHHRVKNNLQVISSLLSLQSATIDDPRVMDAVQESQNRVKSMGLIHQKLYQGENLAAIEMRDYLHTLGESMIDSFGKKAENIDIKCNMNELELDVDTAIPIGLIVNELVTNSIKYAFPDQQKGTVRLSLDIDEEKQLRLVVADDGVGKEENNESSVGKGTGFGSQLVHLLTLQLNGKLEQSNGSGTRTEIRFKQHS